MVRRRREQIRLALPDTLDLLVICVEAGLGLDQALNRVGSELAIRHKAMSEEIAQINVEQRAGKPRIEAWRSMAQRTKLEETEAFVAMLWQSERFGTPIVRALADLCRVAAYGTASAGRRAGGEVDGEAPFSAGDFYLSQHVHRADRAGGAEYHSQPGRAVRLARIAFPRAI